MRVLIVDDEAPIRELLRVVCVEEGHEARTAASVQEALQLWRAWRPGCIFLDLVMPGEPGTELVRSVRAVGDKTPIVIVSGDPRPDWIARVRRFGVSAVVEKPFRLSQIIELLRTLRAAS